MAAPWEPQRELWDNLDQQKKHSWYALGLAKSIEIIACAVILACGLTAALLNLIRLSEQALGDETLPDEELSDGMEHEREVEEEMDSRKKQQTVDLGSESNESAVRQGSRKDSEISTKNEFSIYSK